MSHRALLLSVFVGAVCILSIVTLATWPPFVAGSWVVAEPPAWWQLELFSGIGVALSALPSLAVFALDGFFQSNPRLRAPFAALLVAVEIGIVCYAVYRIALLSRGSRP